MTDGVGYSGTRDPNIAGVSSSGVSGDEVSCIIAEGGGGIPDPTPTGMTWNPLDKSNNVVLSASDLQADVVASGSWWGVRATEPQTASTGKRYFEVLLVDAAGTGQVGVGVVTDAADLEPGDLTTLYTTGFLWLPTADMPLIVNPIMGVSLYGTQVGYPTTIGVLLDFDTQTIEFFADGSSAGSQDISSVLVGLGSLYPALYKVSDDVTEATSVARFDSTEWIYAPGVGEIAWNA